jgi:GNAT superfamily N-acetyltransferase
MRITIRRATVDDLPWLRHLIAAFMAEPTESGAYPALDAEELDAFTLGALRGLTGTYPNFRAYIAWRGRQAVGMIGGELQERLVGKPHQYAHVLWIYVEPACRESDVGFRLLEGFAEWAKSAGVTDVEWRSTAGNSRYLDAGYPVVATMFAAPIASVLDRWRGHAYPPPKPEEAPKDTTVAA